MEAISVLWDIHVDLTNGKTILPMLKHVPIAQKVVQHVLLLQFAHHVVGIGSQLTVTQIHVAHVPEQQPVIVVLVPL